MSSGRTARVRWHTAFPVLELFSLVEAGWSEEGLWWLGLPKDHLVKGFLDVTLAWKCLDGLKTNSPCPLLRW